MTKQQIIYELPLSEPLRVLLRLELLFKTFYSYAGNPNKDTMFNALKSVDEILTIMQSEEIVKYLVNESNNLYDDIIIWKDNPDVNQVTFETIIANLQKIAPNLVNSIDIAVISENNFLKDFRKKCNTIGDLSSADCPRFIFWMNQDSQLIINIFKEWLVIFDPFYKAIRLILKLIRENSIISKNIAKEGYFQESLDKNTECRLIRVVLPTNLLCFADITSNRYHVTIRMLKDDWNFGSTRYKQDVSFTLVKCYR